ncbi:hypothetical protein TNCT_451021 [Trichonephila clavata]|uniref:G-protein coupled receptors family 1 profile domain-containing protein n=1 Tax=Trichonephila clavata TaxID=2740835 RepID=A0A8X6G127_TRICU|nr:hypothetical protein TNCT_451021 [Trichonephila clavata]
MIATNNTTDSYLLGSTPRKLDLPPLQSHLGRGFEVPPFSDPKRGTARLPKDRGHHCVCRYPDFGTAGNVLVATVVWKTKELRNSTNLFLINLSVADLLVLLVCVPPVCWNSMNLKCGFSAKECVSTQLHTLILQVYLYKINS